MYDLRYALRQIRRNPISSSSIILIFALCITANVAVLSIVNATMFRPLPFPDSRHLFHVISRYAVGEEAGVNGAVWQLVREHVPSLEVALYAGRSSTGVNVTIDKAGVMLQQSRVSTGFFRVLGVAPLIGREFTAEEDRDGGPYAVIISYDTRSRFYGTRPDVIGSTLLVRGQPHTVIGIMPQDFWSVDDADIWTPLRPSPKGEGAGSNYSIIARLKAGAHDKEARGQLGLLTDELRKRRLFGEAFVGLGIVSLQEELTRDLRGPLNLLWGAVVSVLLLGCINIGGMQLARSFGRVAEFATRLALGSSVMRLVRQLLIESMVLGTLGGIAGIAFGALGLRLLCQLGQGAFPFLKAVEMDWRVLFASGLVTIVASGTLGLASAFQASRTDLRSIRMGSRTVAGNRRLLPLSALIGVQVAITVPLLLGASLLLRTFLYLWTLSPGFDADHVVTAQFSMQDRRYNTAESINAYYNRVIDDLHRVPGIQSVAVGLSLPYERALNNGIQLPNRFDYQNANFIYVTPEYFAALRIPFLEGQTFFAAYGSTSSRVAIINDAFRRRYLNGASAVGQVFRLATKPTTIIGVVGDVQESGSGWGDFGPLAPVPTVFVPATQNSDDFLALAHIRHLPNWIIRSSIPDRDSISAVTRVTHDADPLLPPAMFRSIAGLKAMALQQQRSLAALIDGLALISITLLIVGIYGLSASLVADRTKELGIRIALGSGMHEAITTILAPMMRSVLAGAAVGALLSTASGSLLKSFLYGVRPFDPMTICIVVASIFLATALATVVPTTRIIQLDVADVLRSD